jgi:hypothetical protein
VPSGNRPNPASTSGCTWDGPGRNQRPNGSVIQISVQDSVLQDLRGLDQPHSLFGPFFQKVLPYSGIDGPRRIHHQVQPRMGTVLRESLDGVPDREIDRDTVQYENLRVEHAKHWHDVRVGEDVEPMLVKDDIAGMGLGLESGLGTPVGLDDQRVPERGFGNPGLARCSVEAVGWKGLGKIGMVAELAVARVVIVGAGDDSNSLIMGEAREPSDQGDDRLAVGNMERSRGPHEVVLGINIPEAESGHGQRLTSNGKPLNVEVDRALVPT